MSKPLKIEKKVEKTTFYITFGEHKIELTEEETKELHRELGDLLGKTKQASEFNRLEKEFRKLIQDRKGPERDKYPPINDPWWQPTYPYKPIEIWCGYTTKDTSTAQQ